MTTPHDTTEPGQPKPCPVCGRKPDPALRPFCSQRCADLDLARWLGGVYRIETPDAPPPSTSED